MNAGTGGGRRGSVLAALRAADGPVPIVAIAEQLRVHPNTVRLHLEALVAEGLAEQVQPKRRAPGRPPLLFRSVRRMDPGGPRRYQLLAEVLTTSLVGDRDAAAKALDAGHLWGSRLTQPTGTAPDARASIERLVDLLAELGFAPQRRARGSRRIGLRHCPFLELAVDHSSVICAVHLGLMRGALENWKAPITVDRLDAFVEPDLCVAHLGSQEAA